MMKLLVALLFAVERSTAAVEEGSSSAGADSTTRAAEGMHDNDTSTSWSKVWVSVLRSNDPSAQRPSLERLLLGS